MIRVCIFDLDGTLTETLESLVFSVSATLKEMGLSEITREECRAFVGNGARKLLEDALEAAGDKGYTRIEEAVEIYKKIFDEHCTYRVMPYEGIMSLLMKLKSMGIKTAVLSNKPHEQTVKVVREVIGDEWIDWVQGQMDSIKRKPDPEGIHLILEKFGLDKAECMYIGDSEVDIQTGYKAKVMTVGVTWGFRTKAQLQEAGAVNMIDKPEGLLDLLQ